MSQLHSGGEGRLGPPARLAVAVRSHVAWQEVALQGRLQGQWGQWAGGPGPVWGKRLQLHPRQWQLQRPDGALEGAAHPEPGQRQAWGQQDSVASGGGQLLGWAWGGSQSPVLPLPYSPLCLLGNLGTLASCSRRMEWCLSGRGGGFGGADPSAPHTGPPCPAGALQLAHW